jgi:hypothetical protein
MSIIRLDIKAPWQKLKFGKRLRELRKKVGLT